MTNPIKRSTTRALGLLLIVVGFSLACGSADDDPNSNNSDNANNDGENNNNLPFNSANADCPPFGEAECRASDVCRVSEGWRFNPSKICYEYDNPIYLGCINYREGAGNLVRYAFHPDTGCFAFSNDAEFPQIPGWTTIPTGESCDENHQTTSCRTP